MTKTFGIQCDGKEKVFAITEVSATGKHLGDIPACNAPDALLKAWAKWPHTHPNICGNPAGLVVARRNN